MYHNIEMSRLLQTKAKIGKGKAEVSMPIQENQLHAAKSLHGMYYFKVLDDSTFFAANSLVEEVFVLTSNFNIHFIKPVDKGIIRGVGYVVHEGRNQIIAEGIAYDENERIIGRGTGTFMRSSMRLEEINTYQE